MLPGMDGKVKMQGHLDGNDGASGDDDGEATVMIKSTKTMMTITMSKRRRRRRRRQQQRQGGYNAINDTIDNSTISFIYEDDNNDNSMVDHGIVSKEERSTMTVDCWIQFHWTR